MHELIEVPDENLAAIKLGGTLTEEDFEGMMPYLKDQIERHNTVRVMFVLDGVDGWEPEEVWDEFWFDVRHARDADRVAVVSSDPWETFMKRIELIFPSASVRTFDEDGQDDALGWIRGEDTDLDVPSPKGQEQ